MPEREATVSTPPPEADGPAEGRTALWLAAIVLATLAVRIPTFRLPLDQDGSVFAYVADRWAHGELPYRDVWDHKPPLTYVVYRGLFAFAPPAAAPVNTTLRVGSALCDAATVVLLFFLARRLFGFAVGIVAGGLFGLFTGATVLQFEAFQPERLTVLFTVAAVLAAVAYADSRQYRYAGLSGLLFGLALIAKQIAAPVGVVTWAWLTWDAFRAEGRQAVKRVAIHSVLLLVGAVLPWGLCAAYFAAHGAFGNFWECTYTFNVFYATEHRKGSVLTDLALLVRRMVFDHGFLWLTGAIGLVVALARRGERRRGLLMALWLFAAFLALVLPGQFANYYYIPTVAPLAIVSAVALLGLVGLAQHRKRGALSRVAAGIGAIVLLGLVALAAKRSFGDLRGRCAPDQTDVVVAEVAREIQSKLKDRPDARIYMRGGRPQVYILSGHRNICPFMYDFHYHVPPESAYHYKPEKRRRVLDAMEEWKPAYLVVTARGKGPEAQDGGYENFGKGYLREFRERYLDGEGAPYGLEPIRSATPFSVRVYCRKGER
jgi:4-amino-4-deoxy-L-arabinose transferase-like glycosyltransferase